MLMSLASVETAKTVAFAAAFLCVWISVQCAFRTPAKTQDLFLALSLFGLNWGVLLLYYVPGPPQNELLSSVSGFLLIYTGVLLRRCGAKPDPEDSKVGWRSKLPLFLFRSTVSGFGVYLVVRRLLHIEYGYGTLALALWGTLLTVLGYYFVWSGVQALYYGNSRAPGLRRTLTVLLVLYALCEVSHSVWYVREFWPPYHRYLALSARPDAPDFEQPLPFEVQPNWPDQARWQALRSRPDWQSLAPILSEKVEPRLPEVPLPLEYGFAALKVLFTAVFFSLLWRRPPLDRPDCESSAA
jgi:hypothetical protein